MNSNNLYNLTNKMNLQKDRETNGKNNRKANKLTYALFIIYLILLFWIIVLKLNVSFAYMKGIRSVNLIPFSKPLILNGKADYGENILNILIFIPLGVYAGALYKKWSSGQKIFLSFLTSLFLEGCQLILGIGAFDVTDIINNTLGGIIGLLVFKGVERLFKTGNKAQKFINIIALTGTGIIILLLLLLKTNNLWIMGRNIRYQ